MKNISLVSLVFSLSSTLAWSQATPLGPFPQGQPTQYQGSRFPGGAIGQQPVSIGEQQNLMMAQNANGAGALTAGCTVGRNDSTRMLPSGSGGGASGTGHL